MTTVNQNPELTDRADILVVDDTPDNVRILSTMLTKQGYEVRKALSGQMALKAVQTRLPELILLDIMMPQMDGYEVCQRLKADPQTAEVPVIFLSALKETFDKVTAFEVGGVDYITKPFQLEEVLVRVKNQLTICRLQHQLRSQNEQLQQLNEGLKRSNQELEQFNSMVSHDLQQPLQSIMGFARLLMMQYQEQLDDDGAHFLDRILKASDRMHELINNLLTYSRLDAQRPVFAPVDCNAVVAQVLADLQSSIEQSRAIVTIESLPTVSANETQLLQLFQNLIHNGLKYQPAETIPQVTISAIQKENESIFSVADNGIGIPPEQFERVFEMFHRVPTDRKYQGTGIGLAICKKIVEGHGGKIWVESSGDRGTTFYFTLTLK